MCELAWTCSVCVDRSELGHVCSCTVEPYVGMVVEACVCSWGSVCSVGYLTVGSASDSCGNFGGAADVVAVIVDVPSDVGVTAYICGCTVGTIGS